MSDSNTSPSVVVTQTDPNFSRVQKRLVIVLESAAENKAATFDNGDDLKPSIRVDLADYASTQTILSKNYIPVAPSNGDAGSVTLSDASGNPASLLDPSRNGQKNYIDMAAVNAKTAFNQTSTSGQLNTEGDGTFEIKKGKLTSTAPSGDDIFRSIDNDKDSSPFVKRVQRVLIENTTFNAENPYVTKGGGATEDTLKVSTVSYNTLGIFGPKKFPQATPDVTENNILSIKDMKKIGILTLMAAAGDITPDFPDDKSNEAFYVESAASSLVPGLGRLGVKLTANRFDSNQVVKKIKPDFIRPTNTQFLDGKTNYSYGTANTPFAPFSGASSAASIASATILITTVAGLLFAFSQAQYRRQQIVAPSRHTAEERYSYLGSSDGTAGDKFSFPILDLPKLKHEFFSCLSEGIKAFFGFDVTPGSSTASAAQQVASGGFEKIINAHGYFNVMLRQITRGASDLIGGVGAAFGAGQGSNFAPNDDAIAGVVDPAAILDRLKGQPIVKFINILVTIGDRMIDRQGTLTVSNADETISIFSTIVGERLADGSAIDPAILIAKDRLSEVGNRSSMANRNMRSLLTMPAGFANSSIPLGTAETANPLLSQMALRQNNTIKLVDRIDSDTVSQFEDYLEKDYMPFYFQDLRTNEILSFHAFVGDLNESLNAEYVESEGYGRIGSVPIYKNTKRNIGFSFYVVSTGADDFDDMWYKVNRLAMMLFPQWSEGRRIDFAGNKLVQPFSQVPAASPLIRFRIGDLWKANYSKFAVARLFGLSNDTNQFKIGDMSNVPSTLNEEAIASRITTLTQARERGDYQVGDIFRIHLSTLSALGSGVKLYKVIDAASAPPTNRSAQTSNGNIFGNLAGGQQTDQSVQFSYSTTDFLIPTEGTQLTVDRVVSGTRTTGNSNQYLLATVSTPAGARLSQQISDTRGRRQDTSQQPTQQFVIPFNAILNSSDLITAKAIQDVSRQDPAPQDPNQNQNQQNNTDIVQRFFAESGDNANPIMKAFKTTEGRGMAGFIKTMSFDYAQSTWETEKFGGRAPKFLKIQIEFLPVWDISPGLDSKGAMNSPIWNVGRIMNDYHGGRGLGQTSRTSFDTAKQKLSRFR